MNPGRYFMPGMNTGQMMRTTNYMVPSRRLGLFGRISNSLRAFNWGSFLSGANRTLNVVNQTIPLVRQAGPMFNNMRSMFRLAKAFGSETTSRRMMNNRNRNISNNFNSSATTNNNIDRINTGDTGSNNKENYPNFFI